MVQVLDLDWCRFGSVIIFDYRALFLCVKSRTCLRITIPAYCLNICGSIFGVLLCLLYSKLILGSKTIWQSMRNFNMHSLKCVGVFPHMDTDKTFSLENFTLVWYELFSDHNFSIPEIQNCLHKCLPIQIISINFGLIAPAGNVLEVG